MRLLVLQLCFLPSVALALRLTPSLLSRRLTLPALKNTQIPAELHNAAGVEGSDGANCAKKCDDENVESQRMGLRTQPDGSFVDKSGAVTMAELADANLVGIVSEQASDSDVNVLLWKCLGYRYNKEGDAPPAWSSEEVFPKWAAKYPSPPDMIGITRRYDPETDRHVRNASMDLMRSIPRDFKGGVRSLTEVGWRPWKLNELTPNRTRRAQAANWLIYYREKLFGKTLAELQAARMQETPADKDVESLPSEKQYQRLRVDG